MGKFHTTCNTQLEDCGDYYWCHSCKVEVDDTDDIVEG